MTPRRLFRYMQAIDPSLGNAYDSFLKIDPNSIHRNTLLRRIIGAALEKHGLELENYFKSKNYWSVGVSQITRPELFDNLRIQYVFGPLQPTGYASLTTPLAPPVSSRAVDRFAVFESWVVEKEESVIDRMSTVDLSWQVVIENPTLPSSRSSLNISQNTKVLFRTAESAGYEVEATSDAIFVEFERFSEGWRAYVDGRESKVFPANYLFRAVLVPPGRHRVTFEYDPPAFRHGLVLCIVGLAAMLVVAGMMRRGASAKEAQPVSGGVA
jgi:hypothetical protein